MKLCGFEVGADQPFFLIAGTCGVESEAIAVASRRLGFDYGQGFLLGKPQELEPVSA